MEGSKISYGIKRIIFIIAVFFLFSLGVYFKRFHHGGGIQTIPAKQLASFPYDIQGVWEGKLTTEFELYGNYNVFIEYNMSLEVNSEYQIENMSFNDSHLSKITWKRPDEAEICSDCIDYRESYTYPCYNILRSGRWLYVHYNDRDGEVEFTVEDIITAEQAARIEQNGRFAFDPDSKSLKAVVNTFITPDVDVVLSRESIETFRFSETWLRNYCGFPSLDRYPGLYVQSQTLIRCTDIFIGGPNRPGITIDIVDPSMNTMIEREHGSENPFYYFESLNDFIRFQCRINYWNRLVEIQFDPAGRKTAKVFSRNLVGTQIPLEFELEKK